jgi:hypothetical protein
MEHFKDCVVGGKKYSINQFLAKRGTRIGAQLIRAVGVPMATLFSKGKKKEVGEMLPFFIEALASRMDEDVVEKLVSNLLSTTVFNGQVLGAYDAGEEGTWDAHFQGRLGDMFKLLTEVVRYQYQDFFSVAITAGLKEMATAQTSSPQTSNG